MCVNCYTAVDALATNSVLLAAGAVKFRERIADRLQGRSKLDREMLTWDENADFLRSMDLDPLATLGPPPAIPASDAVEPAEHP